LLLVAFPLTFAVRLHGLSEQGPRLLLFALVITWVGDTVAIVGRAVGKHPFAPDLSQRKRGKSRSSFVGSPAGGLAFTRWLNAPPVHLLGMAGAGIILPGKWAICSNRIQAQCRREGFRRLAARP